MPTSPDETIAYSRYFGDRGSRPPQALGEQKGLGFRGTPKGAFNREGGGMFIRGKRLLDKNVLRFLWKRWGVEGSGNIPRPLNPKPRPVADAIRGSWIVPLKCFPNLALI